MDNILKHRSLREIKNFDQLISMQSDICKVGIKKLMGNEDATIESYAKGYRVFLNDIKCFNSLIVPLARAVNKEYDIHSEMYKLIIDPLVDNLKIVIDAELRRRQRSDYEIAQDLSNVVDILTELDKDLMEKYSQLMSIIGSRLLRFPYKYIHKYIDYSTSIYKNRF